MAGAYGELTGRPGAALATRGPGAASAVNAAAQAQLDRAPLVLVTDAVAAADAVRVAHQRLDQGALYAPVTRASLRLGADRQEEVARAAVALAAGPPPGAVHVDVVAGARSSTPPASAALAPGDPAAVRRLVAAARRPVVLAGVGVRGAEQALADACLAAGAPVLTTYKAKGAVPDSSPVAAGLLTGATIEGEVLAAADLIVAVGLDPVELIPAPWPYAAPVASIAPWPVPDPYFATAAEAVGPLAGLLPELLGRARRLRLGRARCGVPGARARAARAAGRRPRAAGGRARVPRRLRRRRTSASPSTPARTCSSRCRSSRSSAAAAC